jgi:tetratricopeptide (TPR) repeat protein
MAGPLAGTDGSASAAGGPLLELVILARATGLARAGRYKDAEMLLVDAVRGATPSPASLDLLARVRAQQGRLAEAEALWARAEALDPVNDVYRDGRRQAEQMARRPLWVGPLWPFLAGVVVALAVVGGAFWVGGAISRADNRQALHASQQEEAIAALRADLDRRSVEADAQVRSLVSELGRQQAALTEARARLDRLRADADAGGVLLFNELAQQRAAIDALRDDVNRLLAALAAASSGSRVAPQ